jgi:hypothetical protein
MATDFSERRLPFNPAFHMPFERVHLVPARLNDSNPIVGRNTLLGVSAGMRVFVVKETLGWPTRWVVTEGSNAVFPVQPYRVTVG